MLSNCVSGIVVWWCCKCVVVLCYWCCDGVGSGGGDGVFIYYFNHVVLDL